MREQDTRAGIGLMVTATVVFAVQDAMSRHLAEVYNVWMVVMIPLLVLRRLRHRAGGAAGRRIAAGGGDDAAPRAGDPRLPAGRRDLRHGRRPFVLLGLVEAHAVFACYPLLVAALSGPILGETVGWRRWAAIGVGFVGVLVILEPGVGVFNPYALVAFLSATMFALYALLTRHVGLRDSSATSFFWTGTVGAVVMTAVGIWFWQPMTAPDWGWMAALCVTGVTGHWLLIRCYEVAEASAVQPFAYLQLVFASAMGILIFGETLRPNVAVGAAIVVAAGVFTLIRARMVARRAMAPPRAV